MGNNNQINNKFQIASDNEVLSTKLISNNLEERTARFAENVLKLCRTLSKSFENIELIKQLIRSSGSVAANYVEAQEALSNKDFYYRLRITKKEAKESYLWLRLLKVNNSNQINNLNDLINEAIQLVKIFSKAITHDKTKKCRVSSNKCQ